MRSLRGDLPLSDKKLDDLTSLRCLTSVDGHLEVRDNTTLMSLSGLEALSSTHHDDRLHQNTTTRCRASRASAHTHHCGPGQEVGDNDALCEDDVDALVAQLSSFSGAVTNTDNLGTCPS